MNNCQIRVVINDSLSDLNNVAIIEPLNCLGLVALLDICMFMLIDIDQALGDFPVMITSTDHDLFKPMSLNDRAGKVVYDTHGICSDLPDNLRAAC